MSFYQLTERYPDEESAVAYFEGKRWPQGPYCPKCGSTNVYNANAKRRLPLWKCKDCSRQFTVTSGTVMEGTKLPLRQWLFAFHIVGASKKGISARQLARMMGVTLKTAWHLSHRIRATMAKNTQFFAGGIVETDEAYIGGKRRHRGRGYRGNKIAVQTIVERQHGGTGLAGGGERTTSECTNECPGQAQTVVLNPNAESIDGRSVGANLRKHTDPETTRLMTDESPIYTRVGQSFKSHETVNHKKGDYAHTDPFSGRLISTNAAEGLFANLKRRITGTHHSTSKKHLPRYLEEHDFKYNNRDQPDAAIAESAIANMEGKKLTLFKSKSGAGDSLFDRKVDEQSKHGTRRGMHSKKRRPTGRKKQP
jgi:transposase-like protein